MINKGTVSISKTYDAPISLVWKALTEADLMKLWYFDLPNFKAEIGYTFDFLGGDVNGTQYKHLCEVQEVIFEKKLSYTWKYDGYAGNSLVCFELFEENGQTTLTLNHSGIDTFPTEIADFNIANFDMGWTEILGNSLSNFLHK